MSFFAEISANNHDLRDRQTAVKVGVGRPTIDHSRFRLEQLAVQRSESYLGRELSEARVLLLLHRTAPAG